MRNGRVPGIEKWGQGNQIGPEQPSPTERTNVGRIGKSHKRSQHYRAYDSEEIALGEFGNEYRRSRLDRVVQDLAREVEGENGETR